MLLLLVLQLAGASLQSKDFSLHQNYSVNSFFRENSFFNKTSSKGETEIFIQTPEFCVKETTFDRGDSEVTLREVWMNETNQKLLFLFEGDILTDCNDENLEESERKDNCFYKPLPFKKKSNQSYTEEINNSLSIPTKLSWLSSATDLRRRCSLVKSRTRNQIIRQQLRSTLEGSRKWDENENRSKREIFFIPGTKWCGRGHRATKYTNLGGFGTADACCRRHDTTCPFSIPALESKYGLYNWGISTIMHCACDERLKPKYF
ncbi:uncharacterized protein LOC117182172 isoform X2 [Belonocnema kinseyi]|uniref:uncharacterized protein LOC117182172 isoform X2 n=1 Tax=Belonocnema kinseyi TaxID=2817044 RepID=UPI00143D6151|nr:uncharacterized protein LOC117182172 isoform X2 [Belonocnema kinseyi]